MKVVIALFALVVIAVAAPPTTNDKDAQILRYDNDNIGVEGYQYAAESSNGIAQQEQGQLINPGSEHEAIAVRGEYQYVGPDGKTYKVSYVADENGFQPSGDHLPVSEQ